MQQTGATPDQLHRPMATYQVLHHLQGTAVQLSVCSRLWQLQVLDGGQGAAAHLYSLHAVSNSDMLNLAHRDGHSLKYTHSDMLNLAHRDGHSLKYTHSDMLNLAHSAHRDGHSLKYTHSDMLNLTHRDGHSLK